MVTVNNNTINKRKLYEKIVLAEWSFEYYETSYNSLARKRNITKQEMENKTRLFIKCEEAEERIYFLKNIFNGDNSAYNGINGVNPFIRRLRKLFN